MTRIQACPKTVIPPLQFPQAYAGDGIDAINPTAVRRVDSKGKLDIPKDPGSTPENGFMEPKWPISVSFGWLNIPCSSFEYMSSDA